MTETRYRSLRILMDLQSCQSTASGARGVGRLSHELFRSIASLREDRELYALVSDNLPGRIDTGAIAASRLVRLAALPDWRSKRDFLGGNRDSLDALALSARIAPVNADIVHVSHVFEGFAERVPLPAVNQRAPGQVLSATLHDIIPLLFREHYLRDDAFRQWYFSRLAWLRQADLLLANSDCTRRDAIEVLGIEPWRIATIHGGIAGHFQPPQDPATARRDLARRYKLRGKFVLYAGGDDYRKNLSGAIAGFAALPNDLRENCQLVVACAIDESRKRVFLDSARAAGLPADAVVMTGFVPEDDLVALYGCCDLFVFPSLYEGLGLPVLEAMACGAPVLGADNSSIREVVARADARFDPQSANSIADAMARGLSNAPFAESLRQYGLRRARDFTWPATARRALEAFDEAAARSRKHGVQSAARGWLPRRRIAMFTPLPPSRSGIADYNANFLPFLARHLDIDLYVDGRKVADDALTASFRIFDAGDFAAVGDAYDAVVYEFGNSEFHAHMLPMLEKFPGVVGLHDAYLSGLFGYLDFNAGDAGSYTREMLAAHGPRARRYLAPVQEVADSAGKAMVNLPCSKRVLDLAIGVISHSAFNLDVARRQYPEGWCAPYRIIPQMVAVPPAWPADRRRQARKDLGFDDGDVVITTFGHVTWTKWGDRILDAFVRFVLAEVPAAAFVFAGELANDDFGKRLKKALGRAGKRARITGFLAPGDYLTYLKISDIAIQLRTHSRGGTPKSVLDCLASGLPVIVNNDASFTDYPDDVVTKVAADPSPALIGEALIRLAAAPELRTQMATAGLRHVAESHDPAHSAAEYAAAIHEFIERQRHATRRHWVDAFAPYVGGHGAIQTNATCAATWIDGVPARPVRRPRLVVDVSHIAVHDHKTGIQRVVREIVKSLYCADRAGYEPLAAVLQDGELMPALGWLRGQGLLPEPEATHLDTGQAIAFCPGDALLMLDSSWDRYREFFPVFERARSMGVPVYSAIYDILPLTLPPGNFVEGGREWFENWLKMAIEQSDGLICISRATADEVVSYIRAQSSPTRTPNIGYWHLGSNIGKRITGDSQSDYSKAPALEPYLLMVGTFEPRKLHALALDAVEMLWKEGHELNICIAGKEGWMAGNLMKRLRTHERAGSKLFLIEQPTDAQIVDLYGKAAGLLCLSRGEGFGLPLVEAAQYGTPIVCSDIPVFREVAGDFATYVSATEPAALARQLETWWSARRAGRLPDTGNMPKMSWAQSAEELMRVVWDGRWYWSGSK